MKVLKFGGASVKDADGVRNFAEVIRQIDFTKGIIVISAMGKMTNAFEEIVKAIKYQPEVTEEKVNFTKAFHLEIIEGLFGNQSAYEGKITELYENLLLIIETGKNDPYDKLYDAIVSQGEIISTVICSLWLTHSGINHSWLDARKIIRTNNLIGELGEYIVQNIYKKTPSLSIL